MKIDIRKTPSLMYSHIGYLDNRLKGGFVDFNPEYQRGYVWEQWQKDALLQSIEWGIPFGFIFTRSITTNDGLDYITEIIDGKQRLSTILDFYRQGLVKKSLPIPMYDCQDWTLDEAKELYRRLNYNGTPHERV